MIRVDCFSESSVDIKVRIKTIPLKQWEVGREFLRRVKKAFDAEGIEIPFPIRMLVMPQGQGLSPSGTAAPSTPPSTATAADA